MATFGRTVVVFVGVNRTALSAVRGCWYYLPCSDLAKDVGRHSRRGLFPQTSELVEA